MPTPAYATANNGGLGQVNFNFLGTGGEFPFLNHIKLLGTWLYASNTTPVNPNDLDSDGYPTVINNGGVANIVFIPPQTSRIGNYVLKWDGNGSVNIGSGFTYVSSTGVSVSGPTYTSAGGGGRVVIANPYFRFALTITAVGSPRITNLRLVHVNDEAFLDAGEVFQYDFKNAIKEGNFASLRDLNWSNVNGSNIAFWGDRKPLTYYSYGAQEMRANKYNPSTLTGSTYAMSAPSSWGGLVDKASVITKFDVNASGACNLNVGGTGAIPIYSFGCTPVSGSALPVANSYAFLFYDAKMNAWIKNGGDTTGNGDVYIKSGVPYELYLQLCAEVGADPHFCIPHYALSPMTDLVPSLVAYIIANMPSWMKPTFEPSNEVWNPSFGFSQINYANVLATLLGYGSGSTQFHAWYGQVASTLGQAVATAYGITRANVKTQTKYRVGIAVQTAGGGMNADGTGIQQERFLSGQYTGSAAAAQSGYVKDAAYLWATHAVWANYMLPAYWNTDTETTMAAAYAGISAAVNVSGTSLTIVQNTFAGTLCTISNASPGVTSATNNFIADEPVTFDPGNGTGTPGVLPTQYVAGTTYYVSATGLTSSAFSVAAAPGGARINTSGGSGTVTVVKTMSIEGQMQANIFLKGQGAVGALIPAGTKVLSGSGAVWTLNKSLPTLNNIGVYGGLDETIPRAYAESALLPSAAVTCLPTLLAIYAIIKAFAVANGMNKGLNYEGGYSPDFIGPQAADALRSASCQTDKVAKLTVLGYDALFALSDGTFTFELPSCFDFSGEIEYPSGIIKKGSDWSVLDDIYQQPRTGQWIALATYNKGATKLTVKN